MGHFPLSSYKYNKNNFIWESNQGVVRKESVGWFSDLGLRSSSEHRRRTAPVEWLAEPLQATASLQIFIERWGRGLCRKVSTAPDCIWSFSLSPSWPWGDFVFSIGPVYGLAQCRSDPFPSQLPFLLPIDPDPKEVQKREDGCCCTGDTGQRRCTGRELLSVNQRRSSLAKSWLYALNYLVHFLKKNEWAHLLGVLRSYFLQNIFIRVVSLTF